MITPSDAEILATKTIEAYINECQCGSEKDIANVLMKLASMCGLAMCAVVGQEDAVNRMQGTTNRIAAPENAAKWNRDVVQ